jgi:PadR family transcriptional regulator, regulatory protein PadR
VAAPTPDILRGTLDLLILKALSWGPAHGCGVARWIQQPTDDALALFEPVQRGVK